MKIETLVDIKKVSEIIMSKLVQGSLAYFSVVFAEESDFSNCFFTPASKDRKNRSMIFVDDYEKLLKILVDHPRIKQVAYDDKENCVTMVFESPYPATTDEDEWRLDGP